MEYEDVLRQYLGEFGRYQKLAALLIVLVGPSVGATMFAQAFLAAKPAHHCRLYQNGSSAMYGHPSDSLNFSVPMENVDGTWRYSSCLMYNGTGGTSEGSNQTVRCSDGWEYDQSVYHSTVVTDYDLVCERHWLKELGQSIFMVGVSAGGLISGMTSDRFGRRPTVVACIVLQMGSGLAAAFTTDYVIFLVLRLLAGGAANGLFFAGLTLAIEVIGSSKRNVVGMTFMFSWAVGTVFLGGLAYFLRDWWSLQLALAVMSAPLLSYWWYVYTLLSESPRWLLSNNRTEQAKINIQKAAKFNKVTIPDDVYEKVTKPKDKEAWKKSKKYNLTDLFRGPRLRRITVTMSSVWFATVVVYYALIIGSADLAGDPYLNFVLGALLEIGLSLLALVAMEKWGRRPVVGGFLFLSGAACLAVAATPTERQDVIRYISLLGRCAIAAAFNSLAVYSSEVFPTVVRAMGIGVANMSSRVGGILSPFVSLLADVWPPLPMLTFGILCTLGGAGVFSLPETFGIPLPDTLEDGEKLGRKQQTKIGTTDKTTEPEHNRGPVVVSGHVICDNDVFYHDEF
ncbi:organic cation transporter protein-like [Branchiostoma floridae]|uniref:Organic cation transporter protein-like n=1 Tax=Branchiostoma floridae TaxID=7739 RepID=A0A9J7LQ74_BRAFL|nr:organic cation transporter protein-like [Branchiostoma floridae]